MKTTLEAREELFMIFPCSQGSEIGMFLEAWPLIIPTNSSTIHAAPLSIVMEPWKSVYHGVHCLSIVVLTIYGLYNIFKCIDKLELIEEALVMPIYSRISFMLFGLASLGLGPCAFTNSDVSAGEKQSNTPSRVEASMAPLYGFRLPDIDGRPVDLKTFKGKVLLIVNTASMCGNTPQYADLQEMYERYRERGFEVLAFPANDFGQQEPGTNQEIKGFCYTRYSISFPLFSKITVVGKEKHPLYRYLTEQSPFPGRVTWNFQKYLVDRSGNVIGKYDPGMNPLSPTILSDVEKALATS
jgi:glutathione peroxidase